MDYLNFIFFLQEGGLTVGGQDLAGTAEGIRKTVEINVLDEFIKGAYIYIPQLVLSVIAVYIFVERSMALTKALKEEGNFMSKIRDYINEGKIDSAKNLCATTQTPVARMLEKGISRIGRDMSDVKAAIENVGKLEIYNLEKNVAFLATAAGAAPMLGFLGTVIGMVEVFHKIQVEGPQLDKLGGGMMLAMITTVVGLVVGIIAYVSYNTLVSRIGKVIHKMEARAMEFIDILEQPGN
ncbi:MAG: MotA/TolQ/ExbB proton channel family protein [Flavobacteriales bacterium]|nr:MotA/TolQ/ExbB proton channel family protein [Flavobacteriales bacterium]